jgi:hypothetical protein
MNEFLAGIYNTREAVGAGQDNSDVEKLAEAQILDEALRAEGIDIDRLPGETILKLAHDLLGADSAIVKAASEASEEESESEKEEEDEVKKAALAELRGSNDEESFETKVAEADFLGRVMAHSYWNEKTGIEKEAAMPEFLRKGLDAAKGHAGKAGDKVRAGAEKAWGGVKSYHKGAVEDVKGAVKGHKYHTGKHGRGAEFDLGGAKGRAISGLTGAAKFTPHAAAVGGGGALAAHAFKKKESSAIEMLAEKRAMEWAAAHGLLDDQSDEMKLASVVDQRAAEMLMAAGIDVAAYEAAE